MDVKLKVVEDATNGNYIGWKRETYWQLCPFKEMKCGSWCPMFDLERRDGVKLITSCGAHSVSYVVDADTKDVIQGLYKDQY